MKLTLLLSAVLLVLPVVGALAQCGSCMSSAPGMGPGRCPTGMCGSCGMSFYQPGQSLATMPSAVASASGGCQNMLCGYQPGQSLAEPRPVCPFTRESQQALDQGVVGLVRNPVLLRPGDARLDVYVDRLSWAGDPSARISAYLYSTDNSGSGRDIRFEREGPGQFVTNTVLPRGCTMELAVRVSRPSLPDSVVYFPLTLAR